MLAGGGRIIATRACRQEFRGHNTKFLDLDGRRWAQRRRARDMTIPNNPTRCHRLRRQTGFRLRRRIAEMCRLVRGVEDPCPPAQRGAIQSNGCFWPLADCLLWRRISESRRSAFSALANKRKRRRIRRPGGARAQLSGSLYAKVTAALRRLRIAPPIAPKPASIIAQLAGSGAGDRIAKSSVLVDEAP